MILLLVVCRSEQSAGHPVYSVREDTTSVTIITQPAHRNQQDTAAAQHIQVKNIPEYTLSTGNTDNEDTLTKDVQSVHSEPQYLVCTETMDGEASPGELVLIVASTQSQSPTEYHSFMVPHPGEQAHLEEGDSTTKGTDGGPKKDELPSDQMKLNESKFDLNSSSQTRGILQGSTVIISEEPPYHRSSREMVIPPPLSQPLHLTFHPSNVSSHAITETPEDHKAGEGSAPSPWPSVQNSDSNPTQPRSPSVQSIDCLPTFTSQRPPDLPTALGKRALSNTWNINNITPYEYRYVCGRLNHNLFEYNNLCTTNNSILIAFYYQVQKVDVQQSDL